MKSVTESIYDGKSAVIPLAEVQHAEKLKRGPYTNETGMQPNGLHVVTSKTRWDYERGDWANACYIPETEAADFLAALCRYRSELESDTLKDLVPNHKVERPR